MPEQTLLLLNYFLKQMNFSDLLRIAEKLVSHVLSYQEFFLFRYFATLFNA